MSTALITQLYIGYFNRAPDPAGLAYWEGVLQGGSSITAIAQYFSQQQEFKDVYGDMTSPTFNQQTFVSTVYQNLFGRAPDQAGLDYWTQQLTNGAVDPGVFIATVQYSANSDPSGQDYQALNNKTEAASFFLESLATSGAAYDPTKAKEIVDGVNSSPESLEEAKNEVQEYIDEATGQGPDPDPVDPPVAAFDVATGVLRISSGTSAIYNESGGDVTVVAAGYSPVTLTKAQLNGFYLESGATLKIGGSAFDKVLTVEGKGSLDLTGVTVSQAIMGTGATYSGINGANLKVVIDTDFSNSPSIPSQEVPKFLLDGSMKDGMKFAWSYLDTIYRTDIANGSLETNLLGMELGQQYVAMLNADPANAILDFVAKIAAGRLQLVHDNLLGNAAIDSAILGSRYGGTASDPDARGITAAQVQALKDYLADPFDDRPYYSGNGAGGAAHDLVRAFDWDLGIQRPDNVDKAYGNVDAKGIEGGNQLFFGAGNTIDDFNIVRHEGAGIELALKAKVRGGADYVPTDVGGTPTYDVDSGMQSATRAIWNFDFSVVTGLNGQTENLTDFTFKFFVDVDPTAATDMLEFTLQDVGGGTLAWVNSAGGFFGGDDRGGAQVEQNSVNLGFAVFYDAIKAKDPTYTFTYGDFDIRVEAYQGTQLLATNAIDVII